MHQHTDWLNHTFYSTPIYNKTSNTNFQIKQLHAHSVVTPILLAQINAWKLNKQKKTTSNNMWVDMLLPY